MQKPQPEKLEFYNMIELAEYVMDKYNLDLDLNEVWHWFVDRYEPDNGSKINFSTQSDKRDPEWIKTMKAHLKTEFGNNILLLEEW